MSKSALFVVLVAAYVAAGKLGLQLALLNASASPVWAPTGIAIAAVLVFGRIALPAVFVAAFITNITTAGNVPTSLAIAAGNTLEAFVAGWLIVRLARGRDAFQRPGDVFRFALICVLASTLSALVGVSALLASGLADPEGAPAVAFTWWLGDAAGALVFAPALILWANEPRIAWGRGRALHAAALLLATLGIGYVIFGPLWWGLPNELPLGFLCIPPLIWVAYQFGQREAATLAAALSMIAVWGTVGGSGPFSDATPNTSLLLVQSFLAVVTLLAVPLAAVVDERRRDGEALLRARDELALRAEERGLQLTQTQGQFASFMENLPGLAWMKDVEGRYVYANASFAATIPLAPSQVVGKADGELFDPQTALDYQRNDRETLASGRLMTYTERQLVHGDTRESLVTKFPIPDPAGGPPLIGGVAVDITDRQRALAALRESEERFRKGFENAPIGLALVAPDGRWLRVNQALADILGYGEDELLGLTFQEITHPEDIAPDLELVRQLKDDEIKRYTLEKRYLHRSGRIVWAQLDVSLVRDADGAPRYFISQIQDITSRKAATEALRASKQELERSNEELQRFAYVTSHDLQAPLRHINGYAELLEEEQTVLDERAKRHLKYIREGVERMQQLIDDLLAYSRVESQPRAHQRTALREAASSAARVFGPHLSEIGADLEIGELPVVSADGAQMKQVFQNLFDNAIKFRAKDRPLRIRVSAETSPGGSVVRVEDNGRGFDPQFSERIFEMFQRLQGASDVPGSGLGLAITRKIVERHGGTIWADSTPGEGTSFFLSFPTGGDVHLTEPAREGA